MIVRYLTICWLIIRPFILFVKGLARNVCIFLSEGCPASEPGRPLARNRLQLQIASRGLCRDAPVPERPGLAQVRLAAVAAGLAAAVAESSSGPAPAFAEGHTAAVPGANSSARALAVAAECTA